MQILIKCYSITYISYWEHNKHELGGQSDEYLHQLYYMYNEIN